MLWLPVLHSTSKPCDYNGNWRRAGGNAPETLPTNSALRRITPLEYAVWVKEIEDFARKGRTDALNSFYGHTVMREPTPKPAEEKSSSKQP